MRLGVERFQLLVQFFEAHLKVDVVRLALGDAHVAAGVEAPALRLDLLARGDLAEARHVAVVAVEERLVPRGQAQVVRLRVGGEGVRLFGVLAAVETRDVGDEAELPGREVAVRAVDLIVDVARVAGFLCRLPLRLLHFWGDAAGRAGESCVGLVGGCWRALGGVSILWLSRKSCYATPAPAPAWQKKRPSPAAWGWCSKKSLFGPENPSGLSLAARALASASSGGASFLLGA